MRHLILFHPDGSPVSWQRRLWAKVHNATLLVIRVDVEAGKVTGWKPPRRYRRSHILQYQDAWVYAVPPLHWILRFWFHIEGIWAAPRLAHRLGLLQLDEGRLYSAAKLRWPWCTRWYADREYQRGWQAGKDAEAPVSRKSGYNDGWFRGRAALARELMQRSELIKTQDMAELKEEITALRADLEKRKRDSLELDA